MTEEKIETGLIVIDPTKPDGPTLVPMGTYEGALGTYEFFGVDKGDGKASPIVKTETFSLGVVKHPVSGQYGLMKVNTGPEFEAALEKEARILETLQKIASQIDAEAASKGEVAPVNGAFFPIVVEKITPKPKKLALVLGYHPFISSYRQLVPLSILAKDVRVDLKTATWMLGKMIKTLSFVHALGFTMGNMSASAIMIEKEHHGVFMLDFIAAKENPTEAEKIAEVVSAARIIWEAVGGVGESRPPHDEDIMTSEQHAEFCEVLERIMRGETEGADAEHTVIYELDKGLADRIWPRQEKKESSISVMKRDFHVFCTYPR